MGKAINERVYWYAWYNGFALGAFCGAAVAGCLAWYV